MSNNLGIKKTHKMMKDRLIEYITSQYFGDNKLLLDAADELLDIEGNLYQKPYIESTPSYEKVEDGIKHASINEQVKSFFCELIDNRLGVFKTPFKHQIEALEAFSKGKNLFVATGTGSGKTECFMWPIIYKMVLEAIENRKSWSNRGVRTIIVYPMNALVSDQISRMRSIIGDEKGVFLSLLNKYAPNVRRPQFGMYTGRTPYPGIRLNKRDNERIAQSYEKSYLVGSDLSETEREERQKEIEGLRKIHKYPAKEMKSIVEALKYNDLEHYDSSNDAELMLRYEMQHSTPDILITNYSMLEYMLIRTVERNIWEDTKEWLNGANNKLLVVIDEAHMYSGASGGEVALLFRRLFAKLGIGQEKVQFILTSASMPKETDEDIGYIHDFASNLSGAKVDSFEYIFGKSESVQNNCDIPFNLSTLSNLELNNALLDQAAIDDNIKKFAKAIYNEEVIDSPQVWLMLLLDF